MELEQRELYEKQINRYKELRPLYKEFSKVIETIIENLVQGCSSEFIIQNRVKTISSFANKLFSPDKKYTDPITEINDLCGVRIILPNTNEMKAVNQVIREHFIIGISSSNDDFQQIETNQFQGHYQTYFIQLVPDLKLYERLNLEIPDDFYNLKAEVQIRTYISHGWAANQYKIFNQYEFEVPKPYEQELTRVRSLLTIEDNALNELVDKMQHYESVYGAYMSNEKIKAEIDRLMLVYEADKDNYQVGYRIAKLAMAINNMDKSIEILNEIIENENFKKASDPEIAAILRDLGISHHIKYKKIPDGKEFLQGRSYLKEAIQINPFDSDAWASLGGIYKQQKNYDKALESYMEALKVDPGHPYPLGNYLVLLIQQTGDITQIEKNREMIHKGIERRLSQARVMVDIPWAFFDLGLFNLLLGNVQDALDYYLKAIRCSPDIWMIETTLNTLNTLRLTQERKIEGIDLVKQILYLGIIFHPNVGEKTNKVITDSVLYLDSKMKQKEKYSDDSIVIIAGGTDISIERSLQFIKNSIIEAFKDYEGIIISGGTKAGICAMVGEIQEEYNDKIKTIGYIPKRLPSNVVIDKRYSVIHQTKGKDFSVMEAIQYWYDLMKSGIDPSRVKLIGINGGGIAAFEFHAAIVFGAQVGIMRNTGRSASELINDPSWEEPTGPEYGNKPKKLFKVLRNTREDIINFLTKPFIIDPDIETLQKLLIQHRESGNNMYELNFSSEDVDNTILSGFLTALDHIASEALKVGEILSIKFRDGYLSGGLFTNGEFKVVFLLNETPSTTLEEKIINFLKEVEDKLGEQFHKLHIGCRGYMGGKEMNTILASIFGIEILKLIDTKIEQESTKMLQIQE
ncbi:MAG: tetratricopeptide repeat protein [Promethearchaeota archaeon]|nr:MAG: tetratricopeptide repeat protein [Candidatus Lokiarchaeota archaeon]